MKKVVKNQVLHAVLWILIYVVTVNVGDLLSESFKVPYLTALCVALLSIFLGVYIVVANFKLTHLNKEHIKKKQPITLYLPLIAIGVIQLVKGLDQSYDWKAFITIIVLMIGVGFIEEVIFRGFLLKGIQTKSNAKKAIIISGLTFGIGHIVNLSRGYGYHELIAQIIVAITIGIILAMIVVLTNHLLPGILFHIVFNITGSITIQNEKTEIYLLIAILFVVIPYGIYLYQRIKQEIVYENNMVTMNRVENII